MGKRGNSELFGRNDFSVNSSSLANLETPRLGKHYSENYLLNQKMSQTASRKSGFDPFGQNYHFLGKIRRSEPDIEDLNRNNFSSRRVGTEMSPRSPKMNSISSKRLSKERKRSNWRNLSKSKKSSLLRKPSFSKKRSSSKKKTSVSRKLSKSRQQNEKTEQLEHRRKKSQKVSKPSLQKEFYQENRLIFIGIQGNY